MCCSSVCATEAKNNNTNNSCVNKSSVPLGIEPMTLCSLFVKWGCYPPPVEPPVETHVTPEPQVGNYCTNLLLVDRACNRRLRF